MDAFPRVLLSFPARLARAAAFSLLGLAAAGAAEPCGLCAKAIVTNSGLATCFLERFDELSGRSANAVAVDLSTCETDRGVVEALPGPGVGGEAAPDLRFMLSRPQLDCLKGKLEEPGLVLDPQARIDLGACG